LFADLSAFKNNLEVLNFILDFVSLADSSAWTLVSVYGPGTEPRRFDFVSRLMNPDIPSHRHRLILGDFNFYRSVENRSRDGAKSLICLNSMR
jgi:hypothetical protein